MNIKKILSTFKKSEVFRNSSILISGTALAQLIPILIQPILRRFYSPEIFGVYAVYLSLLGILIVVASFKYELAIILPKKDKEAINIMVLAFLINLVFSTILLSIIVLFRSKIALYFNISKELSFYFYFIPFAVFLFNLYQSINYWLTRKSKFLAITKNKLIRRGIEGGIQIGFSLVKSMQGLILGDVIGHFANVVSGIRQSIRSGFTTRLVSITKMKYVFIKYSEYPKFNVIPSLMSACSYLLPTIFINKFFTSAETGYFDLSKLVLSIPLALIATSISNVLLQSITKRYRDNQSIVKELYPIIFIILVISVFEIITISFYGEELFKVFFGSDWIISGQISKMLVWAYAFNFFTASFSSIYISMKRIKLLSIWQIFYFLSVLALGLFKKYPYLTFIKIFTVIQIISCILSLIFMIYILWRYEIGVRKTYVE